MRVPAAFILLALGLFSASLLLGSRLPSEFLPGFDEGAFVLDYEAPPGTSLVETNQMLTQIETMLAETPEVESYSRRTGLQAGGGLSEPNIGDFLVRLKTSRGRTTDEVIGELRQRITTGLPALKVEFAGILVDLIGDLVSSPQPIEVLLYGEDASQLRSAAKSVEKTIAPIPGIVDTFNRIVLNGAALSFQVDPERAARMGTNVAEITRQLTIAVQGEVASSILEAGYLVPIRVQGPAAATGPLSKQSLEDLPLRTSNNTVFRTGQVADVTVQEGLSQIHRDGLRQCLAVTARLEGLDLGNAISAIQTRLQTTLPNGVTVEYGGSTPSSSAVSASWRWCWCWRWRWP